MRIIYGYQVDDDIICIKEDEATAIKLIYEMYLSGSSLRKISDLTKIWYNLKWKGGENMDFDFYGNAVQEYMTEFAENTRRI